MNFDDYQKQAIKTNLTNDDAFKELMQQVLGLADEAGEVQSIFKKCSVTSSGTSRSSPTTSTSPSTISRKPTSIN
jgi:hypothetical protein